PRSTLFPYTTLFRSHVPRLRTRGGIEDFEVQSAKAVLFCFEAADRHGKDIVAIRLVERELFSCGQRPAGIELLHADFFLDFFRAAGDGGSPEGVPHI